MGRAAIGIRDHSGWGVLVAVGGDLDVLMREQVELLDDPELPRQVYHAAVGLPLAEAADLIAAVEHSARSAAREVIADAVGRLKVDGHEVEAVALGQDAGQLPEDLAKILGNHTSLHVGEGELYREAIADAGEELGLRTVRYDFRTLAKTHVDVAARVDGLRREIGAPWARDHKDAALAGWLALH